MAKEIENPFESKAKRPDRLTFEEAKQEWRSGHLSSDDFLPIALRKLYGSHHLFQNGDTMLRDLQPEAIQKALAGSEMLADAAQRGFSGETPPALINDRLRLYFGGFPGKVNLDRYKLQQTDPDLSIKSWEFEAIDPNLNSSLPLHLYLGQKSGKPTGMGAEKDYLNRFKNAVYDNVDDKKKATTMLLWLHYKGLLSKVKRYEINSILRVTEREDVQYVYTGFDDVAAGVLPYAYFYGWRKRLETGNSERDFKLPVPFRQKMPRQALLTANFMYEESGYKQIDQVGRALKSIGETGSADKIREEYARMQASAIVKGRHLPLRPWDVANLKLKPLIDKYIVKMGGEVKEKTPTGEKKKDIIAEIPPRKTEVRVRKPLVPEEVAGPEKEPSEVLDKVGEAVSTPESDEKQKSHKSEHPVLKSVNKKEKRRKSPLEEVREELAAKKSWSEADIFLYLNVLAREQKLFLDADQFPKEITTHHIVNELMEKCDKDRLAALWPYNLKWDNNLGRMSVMHRTDRVPDLSNNDPNTVVSVRFPPYLRLVENDKIIMPLESVYQFLQEEVGLPINIIFLRERSYMTMRSNNIVPITKESGMDFRKFRSIWYEKTGLMLPTNLLERFINYEGISVRSTNLNRRPATIEACKSHNVPLYESENHTTFKRIA